MKFGLLSLLFVLSITGTFAQTVLTATQVCQRVASVNGTNGSLCAQLIAHNNYDQASLSLANKALDNSSATAIEILKSTANRRVDFGAGQVCEAVLTINSQNGINCVNVIVDKVPAPELLKIATSLLNQGSSYVVNALGAGVDAYFFPPLADVCNAMATVNGANTVACVQTIANKVSMNGAEQVCMTALGNGSSYALQCLTGVVTEYVPVPQPTRVMVEEYLLQDLRRSIMKARAQVNRGMIGPALKTLDEANQTLDLILVPQNP